MNRSASQRALQWKYLPAAALALGVLGAAPANAACTAGPISMSTSAGPSYTCTRIASPPAARASSAR